MGILDQIANPNAVSSFGQGLKIVDDIETRRMNRMAQEVEIGQALQQMQLQKQEQDRLARKGTIISQGLTPQQMPQQAPQEMPQGPVAPQEAQAMQQQAMQTVQATPLQAIDESPNYAGLADKLAAEGFTQEAQMYYGLQEKEDKKIADETDTERKNFIQLAEVIGNTLEGVVKVEEAGNLPDAKKLWEQSVNTLLKNPLIKKNPKIFDYLKNNSDYEPNKAKILYASTSLGGKARDQYIQQKSAEETQRHNLAREFIDQVEAQKKGSGGNFKFTKSDRVMQLARKISTNKATDSEKKEFDLYKNMDPFKQFMSKALSNMETNVTEPPKEDKGVLKSLIDKVTGTNETVSPELPKTVTVGKDTFKVLAKMPDGRVKIESADGRIGYVDAARIQGK